MFCYFIIISAACAVGPSVNQCWAVLTFSWESSVPAFGASSENCPSSYIYTSGCPWPSDTVKSRASTPPPPSPPGFCFTIWFPQQRHRKKTRDITSCLKTRESRNRKKKILILISSNQDIFFLFFSSLLCPPPPLLLPAATQRSSSRPRSPRAGNQRTVVPVPPVQGTREPAGLLWQTRLGTPHGGPGRWKSGSPRVPGRAWSAFCDGPELRDRQTKELIYKIYIFYFLFFIFPILKIASVFRILKKIRLHYSQGQCIVHHF